jgi:hypothetical protein
MFYYSIDGVNWIYIGGQALDINYVTIGSSFQVYRNTVVYIGVTNDTQGGLNPVQNLIYGVGVGNYTGYCGEKFSGSPMSYSFVVTGNQTISVGLNVSGGSYVECVPPSNTPTVTPTRTPSLTPSANTCVTDVTVNVLLSGYITYKDCYGNPKQSSVLALGTQTFSNSAANGCINRTTLDYDANSTADFTILSYGSACTPPSPTPTITPTRTPSVTSSISITPSVTPSRTPSISITPSITPSRTPSRTPSITPSATQYYVIAQYSTISGGDACSTIDTGTFSLIGGTTLCDCTSISDYPSSSVIQNLFGGGTGTFYVSFGGNYRQFSKGTAGSNTATATNPCVACPSPTPTPSITPSITPTTTPSITPSVTSSIGVTPSITRTPSRTPSVTPSPSRIIDTITIQAAAQSGPPSDVVTIDYSTNGSTWTTLSSNSLTTSYVSKGSFNVDRGTTFYIGISVGGSYKTYGVGFGQYTGYCGKKFSGTPKSYSQAASGNQTLTIGLNVSGGAYVTCV